MNSKKRILVAETPDALETIRAALEEEFDLSFALTLAEAKSGLKRQFDILLCGVHFDESRLFEMLQLLRADHGTVIPVVVVHALQFTLPDGLAAVVRSACDAAGCEGFVDLTRWRAEMGDDAAFLEFRTLLQKL